uniref:IRG-type G domain-containing protein n=1 Tax=Pygocentrus nattereri TaxID=42514 RepID=A0AAR2KCN6_PYGNA
MDDFIHEDFDVITVEDIEETLAHEDLPSAVSKIKDYFEQQDCGELTTAVIRMSSSGKSTFINAFRGMGDEEEGSAQTGVVETTKVPTPYLYPKYPNVKFWDLPGIGTPNFKLIDILNRECHATLAAEIVKMDKKFYFIHSKIDSNISAEKRKKTFNEQKTLDAIRKDCIEGLEKTGVDSPVVFLISCFDLALYDFNHLEETTWRWNFPSTYADAGLSKHHSGDQREKEESPAEKYMEAGSAVCCCCSCSDSYSKCSSFSHCRCDDFGGGTYKILQCLQC